MDGQINIGKLCKIISCKIAQTDCMDLLRSFSATDWEELHAVALRHGLILMLYKTLKEYEAHIFIPKDLQIQLHKVYLHALGWNFRTLHHMEKILTALSEENIPVIGLKGIYLVENLYKNIGLRTFYDLDLMVPKDKLTLTIQCMQDLGYHLSTYFDINDVNRDIKHIPPMVRQDGLVIEIHWTILEEDEPFTIDTNGIWQRAIPARIAGVDIFALGYEDLILHLSVHLAYQHHLVMGLRNLYDLYALIQKHHNDIDWNLLVIIATSWGVERVVWLTFHLLNDIFDVEVPENFLEHLLTEEVHPETISEAKEQLHLERKEKVNLTPDLIGLSDESGLFKKIKLIIDRIFISKQALARIYHLPANSWKIYYFYVKRFINLFNNYSKTVWRLLLNNPSTLEEKQNLKTNLSLVNWMAKRTSSSQSVYLKE